MHFVVTCWLDRRPETAAAAVLCLSLLFLHQFWQCCALRWRYFTELESWFKLLIFSLALASMFFMANQEVLNVIASAAVCLAWIGRVTTLLPSPHNVYRSLLCDEVVLTAELIFMIGRYPFLGGRFSIMFYSITKVSKLSYDITASMILQRIIQGAVSFIIMIIAFGFGFFVIRDFSFFMKEFILKNQNF